VVDRTLDAFACPPCSNLPGLAQRARGEWRMADEEIPNDRGASGRRWPPDRCRCPACGSPGPHGALGELRYRKRQEGDVSRRSRRRRRRARADRAGHGRGRGRAKRWILLNPPGATPEEMLARLLACLPPGCDYGGAVDALTRPLPGGPRG